ncbi:MAG TPA: hypothetical protein VJ045_13125, partial [Hyphomicrobiaceae bacterium]|nr:hypothetical protein [Hyphomicrobiaceae bacterium]
MIKTLSRVASAAFLGIGSLTALGSALANAQAASSSEVYSPGSQDNPPPGGDPAAELAPPRAAIQWRVENPFRF